MTQGNSFPAGLAKPALRALERAGYVRLEQLITVTEDELLQLHGMGPKAVEKIRQALEEKGLTFGSKS
ncbi:MAG: DNA-directed RNA polymerase subunit alpha C-terminal domain-containing protein [Bacillaceae bacterium]